MADSVTEAIANALLIKDWLKIESNN
jgi:hypothetical protein